MDKIREYLPVIIVMAFFIGAGWIYESYFPSEPGVNYESIRR